MERKFELVAIPVSDDERAKDFYAPRVGFNTDHDHTVSEQVRLVQTMLGPSSSRGASR